MKLTIPRLILAFIMATPLLAEEPRHLLVAKFTLKRLETANLTEAQKASFNHLSAALRKEVDALRKTSGITKEVMTKRDHAHQKLKPLKLEDAEYWQRLQTDAALNDAQLNAFKTTAGKFKVFKADAMALLTKEQKASLPKKGNKK